LELGNERRHARYFQVWLSRADDRTEAIDHAKRKPSVQCASYSNLVQSSDET
jgi:hypothetical protein